MKQLPEHVDMKGSLSFLLPIRSIVFVLVYIVGAGLVGKHVSEISNWWSIVATVVNLFTILLLIYVAKKSGQTYWQLINYRKGQTKIREILLVCLVILGVGTAGMYLAGYLCYGVLPYSAPMMIAPISKGLAILNVLLLPLTTPFAEDALYLGCGVNQMKNKTAAILVPAFFFALQHCFIPTLFEGRYILYRFLSFLPLTLILCWYYYKKRNPLPIMIGHGMIDIATVLQILGTSCIPGFYETMCGIG